MKFFLRKAGEILKHLEDGEIEALVLWYRSLPSERRQLIESGEVQIKVESHASTTGKEGVNIGLAKQRADTVEEILLGIIEGEPKCDKNYFGSINAFTGGNIEDPKERKVVVW